MWKGRPKPRRWTDEDDEKLRVPIAGGLGMREIGPAMNRTIGSIEARCSQLVLRFATRSRRSKS